MKTQCSLITAMLGKGCRVREGILEEAARSASLGMCRSSPGNEGGMCRSSPGNEGGMCRSSPGNEGKRHVPGEARV